MAARLLFEGVGAWLRPREEPDRGGEAAGSVEVSVRVQRDGWGAVGFV